MTVLQSRLFYDDFPTSSGFSDVVDCDVTQDNNGVFGCSSAQPAYLVTPNVLRVVREHFNCSTLIGAELEGDGGFGAQLSHWEERIFLV